MAQIDILDRKFGMLAAKKGYASKEQINQAFQEQKSQAAAGKTVLIGDILVQAKILTEEQRNEILDSQKELKRQFAARDQASQEVKEPEKDQEEKADASEVAEEAVEESPPDLDKAKRVQNDSGFELAITPDRIRAYIYPLEENTPEVGFDDIKSLLGMEGIKFGIVEDEKIAEYLAARPSKDNVFKVAQGIPVDPGKQPEIKYYFDINWLKAATIDESGKIDYKNRGKIPMVKQGELLAELLPGTEGKPGKDIYGEIVDSPPPDLVSLSCGRGAKRSDDSTSAISEIDGLPELLDNGTICVSDTLPISGDVGVETGHIEFDGHIDVKGAVQEGYRVKGKTLKADEIHNAEIEMQGDIAIAKGIIGAKIITDGTVKARHIRDSKVDALGDVHVEREVYEAHIETNGLFSIERGVIMGSTISAMKGIDALDIGSEASDPCTIITGIDNRLEKQITTFNMQIAKKEKERERLNALIKEIKDRPEKIDEEIGKLAQKQDQAMVKGRTLKQTLKSLQAANDRKNIVKVLTIIKAMNSKLAQIQSSIDSLLKEQEQIEANIEKYTGQVTKLEEEIVELQDDIKSLLEMSKIRQVSTGVKATGKVYDRTSIRGRNSSLIVKGTLERVLIQEIKNPEPGSDQEWLMSVSQI